MTKSLYAGDCETIIVRILGILIIHFVRTSTSESTTLHTIPTHYIALVRHLEQTFCTNIIT
jgi:hypothetical protein